jgi:preprotein translocase subunit Sec61beta
MHAMDQITPEIIVVMCIGGIAFILIFRSIFRKGK